MVCKVLFSGFIDRSSFPDEQGPSSNLEEGEKNVWICETGVLPGHQTDAIKNLKAHFPAFKDDFKKMVNYLRPHSDMPNEDEL